MTVPRQSPAWRRQRAEIDARLADEDAVRAAWDQDRPLAGRPPLRLSDEAFEAVTNLDAPTPYEALASDPMLVYGKREYTIAMEGDPTREYTLDPTRFGRRFVRSGLIVKTKRLALNVTQEQIALALGVSKSLLSRWENGDLGVGKLRIGAPLCAAVSLLLRIPAGETYIAFVSETHLEMRAIYYPDDPGVVGAALGLPLPGSDARIAARDAMP